MSMKEKISDLRKESEDQVSAKQRIRRAEKLAEKFKHVKPETYSVPMERFYGLPEPQSDNSA